MQLVENTPIQLTSAFGASFDSAAAASSLKAKAMVLDGLIVNDDREARELEDAHALRDRAVAEWSDAYQGTATTLEGLYRRAGRKELAEKVRPTPMHGFCFDPISANLVTVSEDASRWGLRFRLA